MRSPRGRHGAVEDRRRRPATDSIAMMRPVKVIELHEAEKAAVQGDAAGEVVAPEDHPPMLGENRLLQALDEAIGPRVAGLDARLADAQPRTGRREIGLELIAAIREHALHCPAGPPGRGHQDVAQEVRGGRRRQRGQDARQAVRARGIAGGDLPYLAHALEMPDVEGVEANQLARTLGGDVPGAAVPQAPEGLPVRSVSSPACLALWCSRTSNRRRRVAKPWRRRSRWTVLGATCSRQRRWA